jgi:MFS family permease
MAALRRNDASALARGARLALIADKFEEPRPMSASAPSAPTRQFSPELIIVVGCLIAVLTFGPRSAIGAFQADVLRDNNWTRDIFSFGIAIQNLLWGVGQPFAGAVADRFGATRVLAIGALLYAVGLLLMAWSTTPVLFNMSAGVLIGFGLSGCSFNLVLGAFGKLLPESKRSMAYGFGTAAGSFGQFLFSPLAVGLIQAYGWRTTAILFGLLMLAIVPMSVVLATPRTNSAAAAAPGAARELTLKETLTQAFGHRSYVLLVLGFFTCGFQLAFITTHFQIYLRDLQMSAWVGGWAFALIGVFNIIGSLSAGWLGSRMPRRYILAFIYFARAASTALFILLPASVGSVFAFAAITGLLWLSTVPPTSSLVGLMFGVRYLAMLYGFAFFSHQVGGFLGVLLGGVLYEKTGSYDIVWQLSIALGVISGLLNLPIVEKAAPIATPKPAAA